VSAWYLAWRDMASVGRSFTCGTSTGMAITVLPMASRLSPRRRGSDMRAVDCAVPARPGLPGRHACPVRKR
jgi:hypothetical protein